MCALKSPYLLWKEEYSSVIHSAIFAQHKEFLVLNCSYSSILVASMAASMFLDLSLMWVMSFLIDGAISKFMTISIYFLLVNVYFVITFISVLIFGNWQMLNICNSKLVLSTCQEANLFSNLSLTTLTILQFILQLSIFHICNRYNSAFLFSIGLISCPNYFKGRDSFRFLLHEKSVSTVF